jgi:hypothetical protein
VWLGFPRQESASGSTRAQGHLIACFCVVGVPLGAFRTSGQQDRDRECNDDAQSTHADAPKFLRDRVRIANAACTAVTLFAAIRWMFA